MPGLIHGVISLDRALKCWLDGTTRKKKHGENA